MPLLKIFVELRIITMNKFIAYTSLFLLGTGLGFSSNYVVDGREILPKNPQEQVVSRLDNNSNSSVSSNQDDLNFVARVVQEVGPSVVRINASRTVKTETPAIFNDPFFQRFFGDQIPNIPEQQIQQGTGSGFIISTDGNILTNAHVIDGATKVTVNLKDGRTFEGQVLGQDPLTDLAVIKINADNLPVAHFGDSDQLVIGEWAIAIGNPLGLDNTVTTGIVSATGRSSYQIGVADKRLDFIQTDAAINPGNSGGPLLNAKGEVIGINTAIIQNAQGLGFAIPINKAEQIAAQLIDQGKVEHPYLGIQMVTLSSEVQEQLKQQGLKIEQQEGVAIIKVIPNSPSAEAGLQPGDVITSIGGEKIKDSAQVQKIVEDSTIGEPLPIEVNRNQKSLTIEVKVGVLPVN
jgi:Do/DeqQ family serine protease